MLAGSNPPNDPDIETLECLLKDGFLNPQVTGMAFMLLRELGSIPLHAKVAKHKKAIGMSKSMVAIWWDSLRHNGPGEDNRIS